MSTCLDDVLRGRQANYLLPFLWQRGEPEAVIREEMARVADSGIGAVCVEARPHPDFLGPQWWRDIDMIMDEARRRGMRVWILDDDHFPTGHAAGRMKDAPAELQRMFLRERHVDAIGPQRGAAFAIQPWLLEFMHPAPIDATLVAAIAARRDPASDQLSGELIDLTGLVQDDLLTWDIPAGHWRIFLLLAVRGGGSDQHAEYINPLVGASVRVLIDTVYEAFYQRYPNDFGQTFAGFFSDEPGFYNDKQVFDYDSKLGKPGVDLPWCADMPRLLEAALGAGYRTLLPLLWHTSGDTAATRYAYMNVVSKLYAEHFTQQIGDWCRAHQVEYIGHVLEDNGVHTRLGCGAGHFFRALWGQDMAGIDVVLWQLVPGFDDGPFANVAGDADGEFFHYGLAKLGASLGHLDPKKRGRTMCELFGAYGWREGLKLMKWMTDHLLVRGVNYFVPHAFSQAEFPDPDCPPHMYARGHNPQYRYYQHLNHYTNRVSHLLSGGRHIASAAVLYHAEAEWSGAWMPFHTPVKALLQGQIDCDVISGDLLIDSASVADGKLVVAAESFDCLIVPYAGVLPSALLARLAELAEVGLPLLFVDGLPARASERNSNGAALDRLASNSRVRAVPLQELAATLRELGYYEIQAEPPQPYLRHYHMRHPDVDVYMFFNEHPYHSLETRIQLPAGGPALRYDAFHNQIAELTTTEDHGGLRFSLQLSPYESAIVVAGAATQAIASANRTTAWPQPAASALAIEGPWSIAVASAEQYPTFEPAPAAAELVDMSRQEGFVRFSGTFRYTTEFEWPYKASEVVLDLGDVYETAEVWINGQAAGVRICPPYRLHVGTLLRPGANTLAIEVTNTLVKQQRDFLSRYAQQEPSGLLGPVRLLY
ncbi:MAG TPA: hypothetical protein VFU22_00465 [Roseiflexaceae bacterium]|nr:hypothetical protein [Roseiflexaceae bacterium]